MNRLTALTTLAVITIAWIGISFWTSVEDTPVAPPIQTGHESGLTATPNATPNATPVPCEEPPCHTPVTLEEPTDERAEADDEEVLIPEVPGPSVVEAGSLRITTTLSQGLVDPMGTDELYAEIEVEAIGGAPAERPSLNVALVVDRSGSMRTEPMRYARKAAHTFVEGLDAGDRAALVAFDHRSVVEMPSTGLDVDGQHRMHAAIDGLRSSGRTNISGGLDDGFEQVMSEEDGDGLRRVVLMTDGIPNEGITDRAGLASRSAEIYQEGAVVTTLGFGTQYDASMMSAMAGEGGGNFRHISSSEDLEVAFAEELEDIQSTVASNISIDLFESQGVQFEEIYGYQSRSLRRGERIGIGDLAEGETRSIMVKLDVQELLAEPGEVLDLLRVRPHFVDRTTDTEVDITVAAQMGITTNRDAIEESVEAYVMDRVEELQMVASVRRAARLHSQGQTEEAKRAMQDEQERIERVTESGADSRREASLGRMRRIADDAQESFQAPPAEAEDRSRSMEMQLFDADQGR